MASMMIPYVVAAAGSVFVAGVGFLWHDVLFGSVYADSAPVFYKKGVVFREMPDLVPLFLGVAMVTFALHYFITRIPRVTPKEGAIWGAVLGAAVIGHFTLLGKALFILWDSWMGIALEILFGIVSFGPVGWAIAKSLTMRGRHHNRSASEVSGKFHGH